VPGYHFHFISEDRGLGGHVLDMQAGPLEVGIHVESELHIAIPETEEFLTADLSGDHQEALHQAETADHRTGTG
jgi:acetolactate decarboxylase